MDFLGPAFYKGLLHIVHVTFVSSCYMEFFKLLHGFVKIDTWTLSCNIDLSKILHEFVKLLHGFLKVVLFFTRPWPNRTKQKFDQDFKAC